MNMMKSFRSKLIGFITLLAFCFLVLILTKNQMVSPPVAPVPETAPLHKTAPLYKTATRWLWKKSPEGLFMGFRSNAPHFWNWLRTKESPLLEVRGVVAGDPHILNFGDTPLKNGLREYSLIDVDDAGVQAPLAGDFLRYFISNQISVFQLHEKLLYAAYVEGLKGKEMKKPELLLAIEAKSKKDFEERQKSYVDGLTHQGHFSSEAKLKRFDSAPNDIQDLYQRSSGAMEARMKDYVILDSGYRVKKSGGSQGLPRFWYLLEKDGEKHIWEFKLQTDPATSFFSPQPPPLTRFQQIARIYRPRGDIEGPFELLQNGSDVFLLRERFSEYLDIPIENPRQQDIEFAKELSLYIANQMGLRHGGQPGGERLSRALESPSSFEEFRSLAQSYIQIMKKENSSP